jgi:alpha-glucoside transport system permease protein
MTEPRATAGNERVPQLLGQARVLADLRPERRARPELAPGLAAGLAAPALVLLAALVAWPALRVTGAAFAADGGPAGFDHLRAARDQSGAGATLGRTLLTAVVVPALVTAAGLALALAAGRDRVARRITLPVVAPVAVPLAVAGIAVRRLYGDGPLAGPRLAAVALLAALAWAWVGLALVVFRAALDRIEPELADAVRALGAEGHAVGWDAAWRPVLHRTAVLVFATVALAATRFGDLALVAPGPGRRDDTSVLGSLVWPGGAPTGAAAGWGFAWLVLAVAGVAVAAHRARRRWPPPLLLSPSSVDDDVEPVARRRGRRLGLAVVAAAWAVPSGVLVVASLRSDGRLRVDAYRAAVDGTDLLPSLLLTGALALGVATVVALVGFAAAAAWTWSPLPPAARSVGLVAGWGLLALTVAAPVVAGPASDLVGVWGLDGTWAGLGLVHVALLLPPAVLMLRNALAGADLAALDHARRRGRPWREATAELAPGATSATIAVTIVAFVVVWGDLVVGRLFAGADGARPAGVLLHDLALDAATGSGPLAAAAVLVALVPLAVVALARRPLVDGLTAGALR